MQYLKIFKRKRINENLLGISLGSGGAKGFAHIGVLKAFEEEGIDFDIVAGTSIGSVIGALYASGMSPEDMLNVAKELDVAEIRKDSLLFFMPSSSDGMENALKKYLGDINIEDLPKPFGCVAVNLKTGKEVDFISGKLAKSLSASCAVPPFFKPVVYNDMNLIDGGYANPIPSQVARNLGAKHVIAVDLNANRGYSTNSLKTIDVFMASVKIAMKSTAEKGKLMTDIMINPDLSEFNSAKFEGIDAMFDIGYETAKAQMPKIKEYLKLNKIKFKVK